MTSRSTDTRTRAPAGRRVSRPHDADEREAVRAADVVARGGSVAGWSFSNVAASAPVHRQEAAPKSDDEKKKEALTKAGEAALETQQGKALKEKVLADPLVKTVKDAVTSTPGLIATGAVAVGGVGALAATGKSLPFQPPAIPLDRITPGLSAKVTYEGPVNAPTFVGLSITYKEQGPKGGKKAAERNQIAADIARLRAQRDMFKTEDQKRQEAELVQAWVTSQGGRLPSFTIPLKGEAKPAEPAQEEKKEETEAAPVQPAPASASVETPARAHVDDALAMPGRPLEAPTRRAMEARFGYDFSGVRVHDDARAAATAASIDAAAFTVGEDLAFASGRYDPASAEGRRLLAHELAHVVQQRATPGERVQREQATGTPTLTPPQRADYEEFVDMAVEYLDGARGHYRAVAEAARMGGTPQRGTAQGQPPGQAPAQPEAAPRPEEAPRAPAGGAPQPAGPAAPPPAPGFDPDRLRTVLEGLLRTYEGSRQIVETHLGGDTARLDRLRTAYLGAADAARAAATSTGRVNLVFIAAPKADDDVFITNATTYARLYFSTPAAGDTVHMQEAIASPDELFDAIETTQADRMIRRIDIFCHGTIEPAHQIRFGPTWYRTEQVEAAAAARARRGRTLQNQTRFDGSTVIELHACRLGAPQGQPGTSGLPTSSGEGFLSGFGGAVGGARGQETVGYEQRWVPRRFEVTGVRSTSDVASGRRAQAFDRIALQYYNAVAGSMELQTQLTEAERAGAQLSDARKIELMRRLYDAGGGAWLIGHQYTTEEPRSSDLARDVGRSRDTFTNEADWTHLVLRVRVPAAGGTTP